jgi:hypothetical protein
LAQLPPGHHGLAWPIWPTRVSPFLRTHQGATASRPPLPCVMRPPVLHYKPSRCAIASSSFPPSIGVARLLLSLYSFVTIIVKLHHRRPLLSPRPIASHRARTIKWNPNHDHSSLFPYLLQLSLLLTRSASPSKLQPLSPLLPVSGAPLLDLPAGEHRRNPLPLFPLPRRAPRPCSASKHELR